MFAKETSLDCFTQKAFPTRNVSSDSTLYVFRHCILVFEHPLLKLRNLGSDSVDMTGSGSLAKFILCLNCSVPAGTHEARECSCHIAWLPETTADHKYLPPVTHFCLLVAFSSPLLSISGQPILAQPQDDFTRGGVAQPSPRLPPPLFDGGLRRFGIAVS